jgi:hypothetical protein
LRVALTVDGLRNASETYCKIIARFRETGLLTLKKNRGTPTARSQKRGSIP